MIITLTVETGDNTSTQTFDTKTLIIGGDNSDPNSLFIDDLQGDSGVIIIQQQDDDFVITSTLSEVEAFLNGDLLSIQSVKTSDEIYIGSTTIKFDSVLSDEDKSIQDEVPVPVQDEIPEPAIETEEEALNENTEESTIPEPVLEAKAENSILAEETSEAEATESLDPLALDPIIDEEDFDLPDDFNLEDELGKLDELFAETSDATTAIEDSEIADLNIDALFKEVEQLDLYEEWEVKDSSKKDKQTALDKNAEGNDQETPIGERAEQTAKEEEETFNDTLTFHPEESADPEISENKHLEASPVIEDIEEDDDDDDEVDSSFYNDDEDEELLEEITFYTAQSKQGVSQKTLVYIAAALLLVCLSLYSYTNMVKKSNFIEEKLASQVLCDLSMALSHALLTQQEAPNNNWSDTNFWEENLETTLSSRYRSLSKIDSSGKVLIDNYSLRVVSSEDHMRFLVYATPQSNFSQWMIPKKTLFLDSKDMKLYKTPSKKAVLTEVNKFSKLASEGISLTALKNQSNILPLVAISLNEQDAFTPPKNLGEQRPGADNYVYNAPRYYKFSRSLIKATMQVGKNINKQKDVSYLLQLSRLYSNFDDLILYSPYGEEMATHVKVTMIENLPSIPFLFAFINFDQDTGDITESQLTNTSPIIAQSMLSSYEIGLRQQVHNFSDRLEAESDLTDPYAILEEDVNNYQHPLFVQFSSLAREREKALKQASQEIITLIESQNQQPIDEFDIEYKKLYDSYSIIESEQKDKISSTLSTLYEQWESKEKGEEKDKMFIAFARAANLHNYLPHKLSVLIFEDELPTQENGLGMAMIDRIGKSTNLFELEKELIDASSFAQTITSAEEKLIFESGLRTKTLHKLSLFLLSPQGQASPTVFQSENRLILSSILNHAGISENEEKEFYLQEFDHLIERFEVAKEEGNEGEEEENVISLQEIPLNKLMVTSQSHSKDHYGRLGQQIISQQLAEKPSEERDATLEQAIALLQQATDGQRSFWEDILSAQQMMTETPETALRENLGSTLGFTKDKDPVFPLIKNQMREYVKAAKQVAEASSSEDYKVHFEHLKQMHSQSVGDVLTQSLHIKKVADEVNVNFDLYIQRLEEYHAMYLRAKDEGYFAADIRYHNRAISLLRQKIRYSKQIKKSVEEVLRNINGVSSEYKQLAQSVLQSIEEGQDITPTMVSSIERTVTQTQYPNVNADNISEKIKKLLNWKILPKSR
jgi:hypothetical protein